MIQPLPKWIMKRYAKLWKSFGKKNFGFEKTISVLKEEDNRIIGIILSELKKAGWLTVKQDPDNARKRIYQLKEPNNAIRGMES